MCIRDRDQSDNTGKEEELASKAATSDNKNQSFNNEDKSDQEDLNKLKSSDTPVVEEELNAPVTDISAETQNDPTIIDPNFNGDTSSKNNINTKETLTFEQPNKTILPIENPSQNTIKKNDKTGSETTVLNPSEKEENNNSVDSTSSKEFTFLDKFCLLYTSDAADERSSVDLGGRRIIKNFSFNYFFTIFLKLSLIHISEPTRPY